MSEKQFNWLFPLDMLDNSPSRVDGYTKDLERQYRSKCVLFIFSLITELRCERTVMSTACVLFHRFYVFQSFSQHNRFIISATCVFLACKIEESYRSVKDIAHIYEVVRRKSPNFNPELECKGLVEQILIAERIILQTLCFDLQITHPYSSCLQKMKILRTSIPEDMRKEFYQISVNFINDSYLTNLCLIYPPQYITVASMFLATLQLSLDPPIPSKSSKEQSWFQLLQSDITEEALKDICFTIVRLYDEKMSLTSINPDVSKTLRNKLDTMPSLDDSSTPIATVSPENYNEMKDNDLSNLISRESKSTIDNVNNISNQTIESDKQDNKTNHSNELSSNDHQEWSNSTVPLKRQRV